MGASVNSDFFAAGFCSCKACIHAIHGNNSKEPERTAEGWRASTEVMYRMYGMPISPKAPTFGAGAKIGDAAKAGPGEAALGLAEKDN